MVAVASISSLLGAGEGPVLVHSDALNTLRLVPRSRDISQLGDAHIERITEFADGRDLWMPTFNYGFTSTAKYDVKHDVSEVGLISERFRQVSEWRTEIPIFNFAGTGKYPIEKVSPNSSLNPFGPESAFAALVSSQGNLLWYGAPFASATILHFVESFGLGPVYRYDKNFSGVVRTSSSEVPLTLQYHVRPRTGPLAYDWVRLTRDAIDAGVLTRIELQQAADIHVANAANLVEFWGQCCRSDPFYFLDAPSRKWTEPLVEKLGRRFVIDDFEGIER